LQIPLAILIVEEAWQPVVAALDNVLGDARQIGARKASHAQHLRFGYTNELSANAASRRQKLSLTPFFRHHFSASLRQKLSLTPFFSTLTLIFGDT